MHTVVASTGTGSASKTVYVPRKASQAASKAVAGLAAVILSTGVRAQLSAQYRLRTLCAKKMYFAVKLRKYNLFRSAYNRSQVSMCHDRTADQCREGRIRHLSDFHTNFPQPVAHV
jgi:hypothetical protein